MTENKYDYVAPNPKPQPDFDINWGELRWWAPGYKGPPNGMPERTPNPRTFEDSEMAYRRCFARPKMRREPRRGLFACFSKPADPYYPRLFVDYDCTGACSGAEGLAFALLMGYDRFRLTDDALYNPVETWCARRRVGTMWVPRSVYRTNGKRDDIRVRHFANLGKFWLLRPETFAEVDDGFRTGGDFYLTAKYLPVFTPPEAPEAGMTISSRDFAAALDWRRTEAAGKAVAGIRRAN